MRLLVLVPILAACTAADTEIATPDSGATQRFVIDDFTFPTSEDEATALGSDLDGDGFVDNEIGMAISALSTEADIRDDTSIRALIGSGQVPSSIEIFGSDDVVGVRYDATQGSGGTVLRGSPVDGGFATVALQRAETTLLLPALVDADPTPLVLDYVQMQLAPTGSGGYDVRVQGLVEPVPAANAVCIGLLQMIANNPAAHAGVIEILDGLGSDNEPPTMAQCLKSSAIESLLAPDVEQGSDRAAFVSIGIALHVFTPRNVPPFE
ncbi:MAG TPA: hypothetical protein VH143_14545 [Kofleriaceae bacterium]|nr:hypothetical protein [Kofleriaceae bacterium]